MMRSGALLFLSLISNFAFGAPTAHLLNLKSKFPYGLVGDDYEVLTINDLALNACHIEPEPFVPGGFTPYEYWQCFRSKTISAVCGNIGILDGEGVFGRVAVKVSADHIMHKFIESRPSPVRDCQGFAKDLKKLLRGTTYACISASYIKHELDKSGQKTSFGIFHRMKTRKGYEGENGQWTKKIRRDYCPNIQL